ncbi:LysR family transcriptional regulator [Parafrankia elaeagni]|uniref:LysR family transcriptional regulator n=1 Tax=Parafrankia elaeagni TaxID=222534 RepID=UPI00039D5D2A|nr:LysR family transcriptional regulator [Parafrankia elaeagni]
MQTQLSLRRLEVFCLVVEECSVTRAAEALLVAQPAVSAQLRALEAWVGAPMFQRQGNRLVLTEAGERTHRWASGVLAGAAAVRREVGDLAGGETGRVVVFSSLAVGTYVVPPVLARLGRERPRADITVATSRPDEVVHAVESGECDLAVLNWDQRPLPETVDLERLATVPLGVYVSPELVERGAALSVAEAMALPLVGAPGNVVYQRNLESQLRAADQPVPHFVLRLGHAEAMKRAAVTNGWGLIAPSYAVDVEVADGRLHRLDLPDLDLSEEIVLLRRHDKLWSPLQQAAVAALRSEVPDAVTDSSEGGS